MALQITNPMVVAKVERLAKATDMTKTALVEPAIDRLALEAQGSQTATQASASIIKLLAQLDLVPDRADAHNPLTWDANGLPT